MSERLIYEDIDKRIYVTREATEDEPQQERIEWMRDTAETRLAEVERRLQASPTAADLDELRDTLGGKR